MLVISRKVSESIRIGDNIEIILSEINGDRAKLCINAPKEIPIVRSELLETQTMNREASIPLRRQEMDRLKSLLKNREPPV
ncbi:MAG: carbon storage regulator [Clostridiales bacterium]|nr:carbon storage regulator [Clostridiales bacterium]